MPRKEIDYSKTIIYKIQHEDNEELVYVGHTTNFIKRKNQHKSRCNNENGKAFNSKLYKMIRANGGWDCFKMVMVEEFPCANHLEACKREDECMRELKATMNSWGAVLDKEKEFERKKQYNIQYYEANLEKIKNYKKQYYQEANREELNRRRREIYQANPDEINRRRREIYHAKKTI